MVVGIAGTSAFGSIDNLQEISKIAKKYKMWFHVDAAAGGPFAAIYSGKNV